MPGNNDIQIPRTTDILSISVALAFIFILCFKSGWNFYTPNYTETIKAEAVINAYQIWELQNNYSDHNKEPVQGRINSGRELASRDIVEKQGLIGKDLWNNPFHYQIRNTEAQKKQIIVWSSGPDGKNESNETLPNFSGDDLGESLLTNF
jgi:hypothetical protein